jgi:hypothetical protein
MVASVMGRKARPVSSASRPRTCCRYSETKNHIAKMAAKSREDHEVGARRRPA